MTVRPIRPEDYDAVNALHRSVWWPERSVAGWRWLESNPARRDIDAPVGWVVEDAGGRVTAFVGNLVQRFRHGERRLHGATGFSIVVAPGAKGQSRGLIRAVMNQPNVFSTYTFNANPVAAALYPLFGIKAFPTPGDLKLAWIVDPVACAAGRGLRRLVARFPSLAAPLGERLMNPRLARPSPLVLPKGVEVLTDLGDRSDYAAFWDGLATEKRVLADRSPAMLRWRLADPDLTTAPMLLCFRREGRITGYAMAMLGKGNAIEAPFLEIIDLETLADEPDAVRTLTQALIDNARGLGAAKVRLQVASADLLERLGDLTQSGRREGGWGHCHARFAADAPDPALWTPTPFDGDYAICTRPPPVRTPGLRRHRTARAAASHVAKA